eukprot:759506-Hanusia_phi.AAC.2
MKTVQLLLLAAGLAFAMPSARCRLLYSGMLNLRGGSWAGIKFDEETKDPIFSGRWQQDVSDEPEDNELKEIFRSRDHVPKPEDTKLRQAIHEGANVSSVDRNQYNQTALHCACDMTVRAVGDMSWKYLICLQGGIFGHRGGSYGAWGIGERYELFQHDSAASSGLLGAQSESSACCGSEVMEEQEVVVKLLELGADPVAKNAAGMTPLLMADAEWRVRRRDAANTRDSAQANSRPLPIAEVQDETKHTCEDPNKGGWGLRLKTPTHRKEVLDILLEAAGNRSYGRGADPLLGGIIFPDPWDEWDEETEFVNPLSRKASLDRPPLP